jgi:hypothetical protein
VGNRAVANRSLAALSNRSRAFCGRNLQQEADAEAEEAARLAAEAARRAQDDYDREYWSHIAARGRLRAYTAVQNAQATAAMAATPAPEPMAAVVVDPIKVAQAVERLRTLRQPSRPVDPSRAFGGGVWLP